MKQEDKERIQQLFEAVASYPSYTDAQLVVNSLQGGCTGLSVYYSATQRDFLRKCRRNTLNNHYLEHDRDWNFQFRGFPMELQEIMGWKISHSGSFVAFLRTIKSGNGSKYYVEVRSFNFHQLPERYFKINFRYGRKTEWYLQRKSQSIMENFTAIVRNLEVWWMF